MRCLEPVRPARRARGIRAEQLRALDLDVMQFALCPTVVGARRAAAQAASGGWRKGFEEKCEKRRAHRAAPVELARIDLRDAPEVRSDQRTKHREVLDQSQPIGPLPLARKLGQGLQGGESVGDLFGGHSGLALTICRDPACRQWNHWAVLSENFTCCYAAAKRRKCKSLIRRSPVN